MEWEPKEYDDGLRQDGKPARAFPIDPYEFIRLQDDGCPNCAGHSGDVIYVYGPEWVLDPIPLPLVHEDWALLDEQVLSVGRKAMEFRTDLLVLIGKGKP